MLGHGRGAPLNTAVVCSASPQHWAQGNGPSGMRIKQHHRDRENSDPRVHRDTSGRRCLRLCWPVTAEGASCAARAVPSEGTQTTRTARCVPADRFPDGVPAPGESPAPQSWQTRPARQVCKMTIRPFSPVPFPSFLFPRLPVLKVRLAPFTFYKCDSHLSKSRVALSHGRLDAARGRVDPHGTTRGGDSPQGKATCDHRGGNSRSGGRRLAAASCPGWGRLAGASWPTPLPRAAPLPAGPLPLLLSLGGVQSSEFILVKHDKSTKIAL